MTKVIIIDDEAIIRESLSRFIDWKSIGVEVCDTAYNSVTAMASISNHNPDIILTDIHMPGLNGLELIRLLREQNISSEVIFISAYANFEYAKQALALGAFDYITKPIDEEEVLNSVKHCKEKIESNRKLKTILSNYTEAKEKQQQIILSRLLSSSTALTEDEKILLQSSPIFQNLYSHILAIGFWYDFDNASVTSKELLSELFSTNKNYPFLYLSPFQDVQLIFLFTNKGNQADLYNYALHSIQTEFFKNQNITITLSKPHEWHQNFALTYTESALTYSFYKTQNITGTFTFKDTFTPTTTPFDKKVFTKKYFSKPISKEVIGTIMKEFVSSFIEDGTIYDLEFIKLQFINLINLGLEHLSSYQFNDYLQKNVLSAQKCITAKNYINQVYEVSYHLFQNITSSLEEMNHTASTQLIRSSLSYIHKHFGQDFTLVDLAKHLYVSPTYLSKIFSTELGQPFSKYLLEYRVKKAIEYLQNPEYKIYTIASKCGFSDVAYFSKAFKSITGMSPNKYRNKKL